MPPAATPSPERIDPADAWRPWEPSARQPWGRPRAAHLYRRATFGASAAELAAAEKEGFAATLARVFDGQPGADARDRLLEEQGRAVARRDSAFDLRGWWLYLMLHTLHPLREKMVLFWHNHFATSIAKVRWPMLMHGQNCLFRASALGKFGPFLLAVSKDAAMLEWLDSNSNVKAHPNENYAREVMELFSLGVGHYTETDVREAARAFTGWHTEDNHFDFDAAFHDDGPKTLLGQTGPLNGDDVVQVLLKQPACARFLVRKLYRFFISEADEPSDALVEPLAEQLRKNDYDINAVVRTMLSSRLFFSEAVFQRRVKSPVEFVLGAVRATTEGTVPQQALVKRLEAMGQNLFAPPNVKGWPGGTTWLNSATLVARENFAQDLATGKLWGNFARPREFQGMEFEFTPPRPPAPKGGNPEEPAPAASLDPARLTRAAKASTPEDVVGTLVDVYAPGVVRGEARKRLVAFVAEGKPAGAALDRRAREAAHAILSLPEYQLA
jgi:uncharacterized protein (DUF1800 family)